MLDLLNNDDDAAGWVDENADADAVRKDYVAIDVSDAGELPPALG